MRRQAFLLALLLCGVTAVSAAGQTTAGAVTTMIFVRHAEAGAGDPKDPSLTPAGEARAQNLTKALAASGVSAVYTSHLNRTKQTGAGVAAAAGVSAIAVPVNGATLNADAQALVARILRENAGKTVLVVGHSNTIPVYAAAAAGTAVDPVADTEFDRMYIVTVRDGVARVIQARY
jgi:broad specificity phosphatase PhoE